MFPTSMIYTNKSVKTQFYQMKNLKFKFANFDQIKIQNIYSVGYLQFIMEIFYYLFNNSLF